MNKEPWWWTEMPHHPMSSIYKNREQSLLIKEINLSLAAGEEHVPSLIPGSEYILYPNRSLHVCCHESMSSKTCVHL